MKQKIKQRAYKDFTKVKGRRADGSQALQSPSFSYKLGGFDQDEMMIGMHQMGEDVEMSDDGMEDISDDEINDMHDTYYFGNDYMGGGGLKGSIDDDRTGPGLKPPKVSGQGMISYFDRAKQIGRVGPPNTELDRDSARGEYEILIDAMTSDKSNLNYIEAK